MVGTTISHYKVLEKISEGGMGEEIDNKREQKESTPEEIARLARVWFFRIDSG